MKQVPQKEIVRLVHVSQRGGASIACQSIAETTRDKRVMAPSIGHREDYTDISLADWLVNSERKVNLVGLSLTSIFFRFDH